MKKLTIIFCLTFAALLGSVGESLSETKNPQNIATLYKDSVVIKNARILIATFNSEEKAWGDGVFDYNWQNCLTAAHLFMAQPDAKTRFWCEKGSYKE